VTRPMRDTSSVYHFTLTHSPDGTNHVSAESSARHVQFMHPCSAQLPPGDGGRETCSSFRDDGNIPTCEFHVGCVQETNSVEAAPARCNAGAGRASYG
jgi:hypothetical protein